ncbi:hypothetical protein COO60DRAFT_148207 [Scenedesmus sp. NREL 46B-D3]|nr:hypothetical protein COO60DRAFT_148207 [Scenedesmus sp. NREL 46B-D3]
MHVQYIKTDRQHGASELSAYVLQALRQPQHWRSGQRRSRAAAPPAPLQPEQQAHWQQKQKQRRRQQQQTAATAAAMGSKPCTPPLTRAWSRTATSASIWRQRGLAWLPSPTLRQMPCCSCSRRWQPVQTPLSPQQRCTHGRAEQADAAAAAAASPAREQRRCGAQGRHDRAHNVALLHGCKGAGSSTPAGTGSSSSS